MERRWESVIKEEREWKGERETEIRGRGVTKRQAEW